MNNLQEQIKRMSHAFYSLVDILYDNARVSGNADIRKVYKSGASDSVIEKYRKYINKKEKP